MYDPAEHSRDASVGARVLDPDEIDLIRSIAVSINRHAIGAIQLESPQWRRTKGICILATAIGVRAYPMFGFQAEPMPCQFMAYSAREYQALRARGPLTSFGVGFGTNPGPGWDGHLVLSVHDMIVDSVAGQVTVPSTRRVVPDVVVVPARSRPIDNVADFAEFQYPETGTVLMYRHSPDNTGYESYVTWTSDDFAASLAERVRADVIATRDQPGQQISEFVPRPRAIGARRAQPSAGARIAAERVERTLSHRAATNPRRHRPTG